MNIETRLDQFTNTWPGIILLATGYLGLYFILLMLVRYLTQGVIL